MKVRYSLCLSLRFLRHCKYLHLLVFYVQIVQKTVALMNVKVMAVLKFVLYCVSRFCTVLQTLNGSIIKPELTIQITDLIFLMHKVFHKL